MTEEPQRTKKIGEAPPTQEQLEKSQEVEHAYLLRRYRIDQEDTLKFKGAMNTILNKQLEVIDSLRNVKETVMIEVSVAKNDANDVKDNNVFTELTMSLKRGDQIDSQIKQRRLNIAEIDREIRKEEEILHAVAESSNVRTDKNIEQVQICTERRLSMLERRLYIANVKFNTMVSENKKLREEVDELLQSRSKFNLAFQKMVKLLHHGNTIMLDLVEMTKVAYEHRDEAQARVTMVGHHGSSNKETKAIMMGDITKQLDHYSRLKDFVCLKGQKRNLEQLRTKMAAWHLVRRKERELIMENYRLILQHIQSLSGEEKLHKISNLILKNEQANFSSFSHVMELHDELEMMRLVVMKCQQDIEEYKSKTEYKRAKSRMDKLAGLRAECEQRQMEMTAAYEEMDGNRQHLDDLLMGVEALYEITEIQDKQLLRRLGGNEIPTEHNLPRYLEIIESFTVDTLAKIAYVEKTHRPEEMPLKKKVIQPPHPERPIVSLEQIDPQEPCAICAETTELSNLDLDLESGMPQVLDMPNITRNLEVHRQDADKHLHSLSLCPLPRSKKLEAKSRNTNSLGGSML